MGFEELTQKVVRLGKDAVEEMQRLNEVRVLNSRVSAEKKKINTIYLEMGKKLYNQYKDAPLEGFEAEMHTITEKLVSVEELREQVRKVKGVKLCPNCHVEVSATEIYCSNCGAKLPETEAAKEENEAEVQEEEAVNAETQEDAAAEVEVEVEVADVAEDAEDAEIIEEVLEEAADAEDAEIAAESDDAEETETVGEAPLADVPESEAAQEAPATEE